MNCVKTGVRTAADELAGRALGPVAGPLVVQAGADVVNAALDDDKD